MAGIGFELRKIERVDTTFSHLRARTYSIILSNGSWMLATAALILIYFYIEKYIGHRNFSIQFLVITTYLLSSSLITSSVMHHSLNRFIADCLFKDEKSLIRPNTMLALLLVLVSSIIIGYIGSEIFLYDQPLIIKVVTASEFVVLNIVWVFSNILTGMKKYKFILVIFLLCYLLVFVLALYLYHLGLAGLLIALYAGHVLLFLGFFIYLFHYYPSRYFFRWEFFQFIYHNYFLFLGNFLFFLGLWVDKYLFWIYENTSMNIVGALRASPIYDMPMFLAFITTIPGMAIFFYEIELNFSRYYHRYYDGIRDGATLSEISEKHSLLIGFAEKALISALRTQTVMAFICIMFARDIFNFLGLPLISNYIFKIDVVSALLMVFLVGLMNLLYYLDQYKWTFYISLTFVIVNTLLTIAGFFLGPLYYGYSFALSLLLSSLLAMLVLRQELQKLTYKSFMFN